MSINCLQLTVKSVTFFAKQKSAPLFTSAEAGVQAVGKPKSRRYF